MFISQLNKSITKVVGVKYVSVKIEKKNGTVDTQIEDYYHALFFFSVVPVRLFNLIFVRYPFRHD